MAAHRAVVRYRNLVQPAGTPPPAKRVKRHRSPEEEARLAAERAAWEAERAKYKPGQKLPRRLRRFNPYAKNAMGPFRRKQRKQMMAAGFGTSDKDLRRNRRILDEIDAGKHDARIAREESWWMIESECGQDDTLWHQATLVASDERIEASARFSLLSLTRPDLWRFLVNRRERAKCHAAIVAAKRSMTDGQKLRLAWFEMTMGLKDGTVHQLWSYVEEALRLVAIDAAHPASMWVLIPSWLKEQIDLCGAHVSGDDLPFTMDHEALDAIDDIEIFLNGLASKEKRSRGRRGYRHRIIYAGFKPKLLRNWEEDGPIEPWRKITAAAEAILAGGYPEP